MSIWADLEHRDRRTRQGIQELYSHAAVTATDVERAGDELGRDLGGDIAFVLSQPRHLAVSEVLLRPAGRA